MSLRFTLNDYDPVDIPLEDSALEAWSLQFDRADKAGALADVSRRIAATVADALSRCLDWDLQPPSDKQLRFAAAIARELNLSVNGETLRYKGAMTEFLNRHAATFNAQHANRIRLRSSESKRGNPT